MFFSLPDDGGSRPVAGQFPSVGRLEFRAIGHSAEATSASSQWRFLEFVGQLDAKELPKTSVAVFHPAEVQVLQPE